MKRVAFLSLSRGWMKLEGIHALVAVIQTNGGRWQVRFTSMVRRRDDVSFQVARSVVVIIGPVCRSPRRELRHFIHLERVPPRCLPCPPPCSLCLPACCPSPRFPFCLCPARPPRTLACLLPAARVAAAISRSHPIPSHHTPPHLPYLIDIIHSHKLYNAQHPQVIDIHLHTHIHSAAKYPFDKDQSLSPPHGTPPPLSILSSPLAAIPFNQTQRPPRPTPAFRVVHL